MALLTSDQLAALRRQCARGEIPVNYTKAQINAALQAIEDTFESAALQNAISNAINTATSPLVLTAAQKRVLVKHWLASRFERGN
jgi:hypothetical protein